MPWSLRRKGIRGLRRKLPQTEAMSDTINRYKQQFKAMMKSRDGDISSTVELRQGAMDCFSELGFPTTRMEAWRETDISQLTKRDYSFATTKPLDLSHKDIAQFLIDPAHVSTVVIVDGNYSEELSSIHETASKAGAIKLFSEIANNEVLKSTVGSLAPFQKDAFVALNIAFMSDGIFIRVPKNEIIPKPIHILYLTTSHEKEVMFHHRNFVVLEEGSEATIIEHYASLDGSPSLTNVVTEMIVGKNAGLRHVKIQEESDRVDHIATTQADIQSNGNYTTSTFLVGSRLGRNDLRVRLAGKGAECSMSGLVLASEEQHLDNHTLIDHEAPYCTSRELFKGIHTDSSRSVFNGCIVVRKDAQQTNSEQTNKNLLLSDNAVVNSNPQLEIYADDVSCSHGSTTGQLDEDAIFYLRSRGLDVLTAQGLLINGFANEIIDSVQIGAVNIYLYRLLSNWLAQMRINING